MRIRLKGFITKVILIILSLILAMFAGMAIAEDGIESSLIRALVICFSVLIVAIWPLSGIYVILILSPLKAFDFGSGLFSLSRIAGLGTMFALLAYYVHKDRRFRGIGIEGPVFLIILGMSLSFLHTTKPSVVFLEIFSLVSLYALVFLIVNVVENEKQLKHLVLVFLVSAIYPIGLAIAQWFEFPYRTDSLIRVSGSFTKPTGLGAFLIPVLLIAIPLIVCSGFSRWVRISISILFGAGIVALIVSFTRASWIALLLGIVVYSFTPILGRITTGRRKFMLFVPIVLLIGAILVFWPSIESRLFTPISDLILTGESEDSVVSRREEIAAGVYIIADNYLLGTGIGNYGQGVRNYQQQFFASLMIPRVPHNIIFYFLGELGIISAIGLLWLLIRLYQISRSHYRQLSDDSEGLLFAVYIGSVASLVGYISFTLFHNGFYTNEIWITVALLIVTVSLSEKKEVEAHKLDNVVLGDVK